MLEKLEAIAKKYEELGRKTSEPELSKDQKKHQEALKAYSELAPLAEKIKEYKRSLASFKETEDLLEKEKDQEMRNYLQEELANLKVRQESLEKSLKEMLAQEDPLAKKDIIMEIRAGTGGEEASLFAGDLFRMYQKYAENLRLKVQVIDSHPTAKGGFKEIIFEVKGESPYGRLKYESGVHRVQRVPVTESGGRIHTSTATVAVLPEAEEVEVKLSPQELKVETYRSSGPGGQHANVTDSAVRITHQPSGIVVSSQEERSQFQNKERALKVLRARLFERRRQDQEKEVAQARKLQVGTGERAEKIRTYNFPQNRVTDHRIDLTIYNLDAVLEGNLDKIIAALAAAEEK